MLLDYFHAGAGPPCRTDSKMPDANIDGGDPALPFLRKPRIQNEDTLFSVVHFSRGTLPQKKDGKRGLLGDVEAIKLINMFDVGTDRRTYGDRKSLRGPSGPPADAQITQLSWQQGSLP